MRSTGLKKNLIKYSIASDRKTCVELNNRNITVKRQTELLGINRTSVYRKSAEPTVSEQDLWIMRRIDEIHTAEPTWGYRTITRILQHEGIIINRKKVRRLMRDMGVYAIYPKPNLSKRYHAQYVRPYLLRNLEITRPNQVWGVDIPHWMVKVQPTIISEMGSMELFHIKKHGKEHNLIFLIRVLTTGGITVRQWKPTQIMEVS